MDAVAVPDNVFELETMTHPHTRSNRSATWKYYEPPNRRERTAVCKRCNETLSYKSSISNLKKHLQRRHNMFTKDGSGNEEMSETYLEGESEDGLAQHKFPRTSIVWKHYEVPNREARTAECKHCRETLSYKSGISNLKKHLIRHDVDFKNDSDDEVVMSETYLEEEDDSDIGDEPKDKRRSLRSSVWQYFDVTDQDQRTATCRLCSEELSYRSTSTNLVKHLKRKHDIVFAQSERDNEDDTEKTPRKSSNNRTSIAWDYFTIKDEAKRLATCKVCDRDCSYFSSTSNLLKHVRRAHGMGCITVDEHEDDQETEVKMPDTARRSSIWAYFKHIDRAACLAVCLICKKKLSYLTSITNLKRHLIRKHPRLKFDGILDAKQMIIGSDGQLYEIDENTKQEILDDEDDDDDDNGNDNNDEQNAEPMEIYLDEVEGNVIEKREKKPVKKVKRVVIDDGNDSDDEEITFKKRYVKTPNDSLDKFGSYLVSLLRQLPKADSNRLQADFVKQIMNCQSNESVGEYVTTVTECKDDLVTVSSASNDEVFVQTTIVDNDCQ